MLLVTSLLLPGIRSLTIQKFDVQINVEIENPPVPSELAENFVDVVTLAPINDQNLERVDLDVPTPANQISLMDKAELDPLAQRFQCPSRLYKRCEQCCACGDGPGRPMCSKRDQCAALYWDCMQAVNTRACTCMQT